MGKVQACVARIREHASADDQAQARLMIRLGLRLLVELMCKPQI